MCDPPDPIPNSAVKAYGPDDTLNVGKVGYAGISKFSFFKTPQFQGEFLVFVKKGIELNKGR